MQACTVGRVFVEPVQIVFILDIKQTLLVKGKQPVASLGGKVGREVRRSCLSLTRGQNRDVLNFGLVKRG